MPAPQTHLSLENFQKPCQFPASLEDWKSLRQVQLFSAVTSFSILLLGGWQLWKTQGYSVSSPESVGIASYISDRMISWGQRRQAGRMCVAVCAGNFSTEDVEMGVLDLQVSTRTVREPVSKPKVKDSVLWHPHTSTSMDKCRPYIMCVITWSYLARDHKSWTVGQQKSV